MARKQQGVIRAPEPRIERLVRPFRAFAQVEASGGVVLLAAALLALVWANSPWAASYTALWQTKLTVGVGDFALSKALLLWINDGLMVIFFFVVGLEIKRELLAGELASPRRAALPMAAAIGGMVVPALIYTGLAGGTEGAAGWGIPMATDIAFALGVLALLGPRAPLALKVFLTALAIVDDLGAVLIIAIFYTPSVAGAALSAAAAFFAAAVLTNWLGVRRPLPYVLIGMGLWLTVLLSGVHATVAGVLLAMTIPARARIDAEGFLVEGRSYLGAFERAGAVRPSVHLNQGQQAAVQALEQACEHVETPLQRLEHTLHPWVAFFIMPVFALANAGVTLGGDVAATVTQPVTLGVFAGLVIGKQVGVLLFAWLAVRLGLAALPSGVRWRHIYGAGWLAGIGFTMSLFIAGLAFDDAQLLTAAKLGILSASTVAGLVGFLLLRTTPLQVDVRASESPVLSTTPAASEPGPARSLNR